MEPQQPTTTPEPGTRWEDIHHDVWTMGTDGTMSSPETADFTYSHVVRKWGPLVELPRLPDHPAHNHPHRDERLYRHEDGQCRLLVRCTNPAHRLIPHRADEECGAPVAAMTGGLNDEDHPTTPHGHLSGKVAFVFNPDLGACELSPLPLDTTDTALVFGGDTPERGVLPISPCLARDTPHSRHQPSQGTHPHQR